MLSRRASEQERVRTVFFRGHQKKSSSELSPLREHRQRGIRDISFTERSTRVRLDHLFPGAPQARETSGRLLARAQHKSASEPSPSQSTRRRARLYHLSPGAVTRMASGSSSSKSTQKSASGPALSASTGGEASGPSASQSAAEEEFVRNRLPQIAPEEERIGSSLLHGNTRRNASAPLLQASISRGTCINPLFQRAQEEECASHPSFSKHQEEKWARTISFREFQKKACPNHFPPRIPEEKRVRTAVSAPGRCAATRRTCLHIKGSLRQAEPEQIHQAGKAGAPLLVRLTTRDSNSVSSALGVLRTLARLVQTNFLALDHTGVTGHIASLAQRRTQGLIIVHQRTRNAMANSTSLS